MVLTGFARAVRSWSALPIALLLALSMVVFEGAGRSAHAAEAITVSDLLVEHGAEPLAVDAAALRFSWKLSSADRGVVQASYRLRLAPTVGELDTSPLWDSGTVTSGESLLVEYAGPTLAPQARYYWQVRSISANGADSGWSEPASFVTALSGPEAWPAQWISAPRADTLTDFSVEMDLTVKPGSAAGVYLRSSKTGAYMWQLNDEVEGTPKLRPHKRGSGSLSVMAEVALVPKLSPDVLKQRVTMRIELVGATITTFINDTQVDQRTDSSVTAGSIGLRTSGSEEAVIHRIAVKAAGASVIDADLATDPSPFVGGIPVPGSGLKISGSADVPLREQSSSPMLRDEFSLTKPVASARLYASALGVYEAHLNGERVGDQELAPGWTDYNIRTQYQVYDVTGVVHEGANALGILAGPGWYAGSLGWFGPQQYGSTPAVSAFIDVRYQDGTRETVVTDDSWRSAASPITYSDLLMGETYDARLEQPGWDRAGYDASSWSPVALSSTDATSTLVAQVDPPVRVTEQLSPVALNEPSPGVWVFDLGQNMVGRVRLEIAAEAGEVIRLRHAEVTHADGSIAPENLRSAKATDFYTVGQDGVVVYEPRFTFHGFRYVEVTGISAAPSLGSVTGIVLNTDGELTSSFETSDALVNQLQSNITWSQRGNFLSIPTDTPARDERLGWTGDINVFAPTANFNMDTAAFFTKWMADMRDAQLPNGAYPEVAPQFCKSVSVHSSCGGGSSGWADAGITVPWTVWQSYGDTRIIEENYDSMAAYIDFLEAQAPSGVRPGAGTWGDWLNLSDPTPANLLGTAFYARSVDLMSEMAEAIGRSDEASEYRALFQTIRTAYDSAFISADGMVQGNSQTGYVISIAFGLVPDERLDAVGTKLVAALESRGTSLATGFLGTPSLLPGLSATGHDDIAYQLLLKRSYPSWGFQIDRGATTMWERWDSIKEDGSFGDLGMNSFNHYAYGAVGDWMYRTIGGISALEPGYKKIGIAPRPGGGLTYANVSYESGYGRISSRWNRSEAGFALDVDVPANTTAVIELPATNAASVLEGGIPAGDAAGVTSMIFEEGTAKLEIGSGRYSFLVDADAGRFGELEESIEVFRAAVEDATLDEDANAALLNVARSLSASARSAAAFYAADEQLDSAGALHEALGQSAQGQAIIVGLAPPSRQAMEAALAHVDAQLSTLSARMLDISAEIDSVPQSVLPAQSASLQLQVRNDGAAELGNVAWQATPRDGWTTEPKTAEIGTIGAGESAQTTIRATVPARHQPGNVPVATALTYEFRGTRAAIALGTTVNVGEALTLLTANATPGQAEPGESVTVSAQVSNTADVDVSTALSAQLPAASPGVGALTVIPAGETVRLEVPMLVPLTASAAHATIDLALVAGDITYATGEASLTITLPELAVGVSDHVDLGVAESESAHELTASARSGSAPNEANLTRRYTNRTDPEGFFEVTMAVPAGEPFVIRALETFDGNRLKDYDILVDGVLVYSRLYQRSLGAGSHQYQVVVDDPALIDNDGTVRIRFQNNPEARNYDPSIADVWTLAFHDYVDLGDYLSEEEHALTASSRSGRNVEAGYTRRYANREDSNGFYEFDLAVTPGEPFLVRALETYDRAHTKEYDVYVDGVLVHQRNFTRSAGLGTELYQFLVSDPEAIDNDGTVRIRFQNNPYGRNYDASLAEVWAVGLPADTEPPSVTSHVLARSGKVGAEWYSEPVEVHLFGTDAYPGAVEIEYRVDGGAWQAYQSPVTVRAEGSTLVEYRGRDAAGNTSVAASETIRIDLTAPVVEAVVDGESSGEWFAPGATVVLTGSDALSGVAEIEYRAPDGEWASYDEAIPVGLGHSILEYRARDHAGNVGIPERMDVQVDGAAPGTAASLNGPAGPSGWHLSAPTLTISATDEASGVATIEYQLGTPARQGAPEWLGYEGPIGFGDGVTSVAYRATDRLGNTSEAALILVQVDTEAPSVIGELNGSDQAVLSAADAVSGPAWIEFQLGDGDSWSTYSSPISPGAREMVVRFRSFDKAGNVSEIAALSLPAAPTDPTEPGPTPSATPAPEPTGSPSGQPTGSPSGQPTASPTNGPTSGEHGGERPGGPLGDTGGPALGIAVAGLTLLAGGALLLARRRART